MTNRGGDFAFRHSLIADEEVWNGKWDSSAPVGKRTLIDNEDGVGEDDDERGILRSVGRSVRLSVRSPIIFRTVKI